MLEQRYGKERIAVLGHSWGTMLGHILVQTHPEHFSVYLATGVVAGVVENETVGYQGTLAIARQRGDEETVAALASMSIEPLTAEPETGLDG
jgi:pimeloyl-ACP methyl ester carboxylesterase